MESGLSWVVVGSCPVCGAPVLMENGGKTTPGQVPPVSHTCECRLAVLANIEKDEPSGSKKDFRRTPDDVDIYCSICSAELWWTPNNGKVLPDGTEECPKCGCAALKVRDAE